MLLIILKINLNMKRSLLIWSWVALVFKKWVYLSFKLSMSWLRALTLHKLIIVLKKQALLMLQDRMVKVDKYTMKMLMIHYQYEFAACCMRLLEEIVHGVDQCDSIRVKPWLNNQWASAPILFLLFLLDVEIWTHKVEIIIYMIMSLSRKC